MERADSLQVSADLSCYSEKSPAEPELHQEAQERWSLSPRSTEVRWRASSPRESLWYGNTTQTERKAQRAIKTSGGSLGLSCSKNVSKEPTVCSDSIITQNSVHSQTENKCEMKHDSWLFYAPPGAKRLLNEVFCLLVKILNCTMNKQFIWYLTVVSDCLLNFKFLTWLLKRHRSSMCLNSLLHKWQIKILNQC